MEGNFSSKVRDVIQFSREEALRLGHDYIGTEHLILGIVRLGDGVAVRILKNLDCDLFKLKKTIEDTVRGTGGSVTVGNIPLTKQAEKVLRITYLEAKLYKSDTIGTEHLLLSLLRDDENIAAQILQQFSVSYDAVREELDLIISGKSREDSDEGDAMTASASTLLLKALRVPVVQEKNEWTNRKHRCSITSGATSLKWPKKENWIQLLAVIKKLNVWLRY